MNNQAKVVSKYLAIFLLAAVCCHGDNKASAANNYCCMLEDESLPPHRVRDMTKSIDTWKYAAGDIVIVERDSKFAAYRVLQHIRVRPANMTPQGVMVIEKFGEAADVFIPHGNSMIHAVLAADYHLLVEKLDGQHKDATNAENEVKKFLPKGGTIHTLDREKSRQFSIFALSFAK